MRRVVWRSFWTSRVLIMLVGMGAVLNIGLATDASALDPSGLTHPFGYFGNLLVSPFARWDSVWYLAIAKAGYAAQPTREVFFPLYPDLIRVVGWVVSSQIVAGILISLVCFAIALAVLYRLVCLDFSEEVAETAVLVMAFFPASLFFSAVYTESLFLALSLGAIYRARQGKWLWASVLGGLAALSRNGGVLLLAPIAILLLYGPRPDGAALLSRWAQQRHGLRVLLPKYRMSPGSLVILLIPLGLFGYLLYLQARYGTGKAPFQAESAWFHQSTWPFGGAWQGIVAAWDGLRQVLHGPPPPVYFKKNGGSALVGASQDVELLGFLVLAAVGFVGVLRRMPIAYSAYTFLGLALPLSDPVVPQPLQSLPRYEMVLFPLIIWIADVLVRRRWTTTGIALSAIMLGFFSAEFATWRFVA